MQLIENDGAQVGEEMGRVGMAEQKGELLGCRQQHVGRPHALALPLADRRIGRSRLDPDGELHLRDWRQQVTRHVDRECLER